MADESKPAEIGEKIEEKSENSLEDNPIELNTTEEKIDDHNQTCEDSKSEPVETSPDVSSSNKSRYGRARKPKITEDYYNIEDIFCPYERITSLSPRKKSQKSEPSPKKTDSLSIDIKPVDINSILSMNITDISEVSAEMSKVMKIVSNNEFPQKSPTFSNSKPVKTYANKKKILESHEYLNGGKFSDSDLKSNLSDESLSNDSIDFKITKKYTRKSVNEDSKDEDLDSDIFKKNKQLKKLQRSLNIDGFKEGRLRSSITYSSNEEEKEENVVQGKHKIHKTFAIGDSEENIALLEATASYTPNIGDLSWSRVGSYPFWPSIVTREPTTNRHCKVSAFGRRNILCYHVHFFGDNGRRSWVYGTHIFPFNKRSDLEVMAQSVCRDSRPKDPKHLSAYIINPNKLKKWELAVTEAESLTDFTKDVRVKKFFNLIGPKKKNSSSEVDRSKLDSKIKIKKYKKKVKYIKKELKDEDYVYKYKDYKPKSKKVEEKEKRKIKEEMKIISEDSFSESDISVTVKEPRDTPSPQLSTNQRLKKINLFKGVTKERACQICGKNTNVYKCKGNCHGLYHIECDKKVRRKLINRSGDTYSDSESEEEVDKKKIKRRNSSTNSDKSVKSEIKVENEDEKLKIDKKNEEIIVVDVKLEDLDNEDEEEQINEEKTEIVSSILTEILDNVFDKTQNEEKEENKSQIVTLSVAEQIDLKMQEVMQNLITETKYTDSTTDEENEEMDSKKSSNFEEYSHLPFFDEDIPDMKPKVKTTIIKHVTADGIFDVIEEEELNPEETFRCAYCSTGVKPPCFICNKYEAKSGNRKRHRCFTHQCGKYFHSECLMDWPQTKWNVSSKSKKIENETLCCPYHNCHTCISDNPRGPLSRYTNEKLAKCIRCPTTYHSSTYCIPAGTEILSVYQLICPKHLTEDDDDLSSPSSKRTSTKVQKNKIMPHVNASWCFICSTGGSLICCETCPSAFHEECLKLVPPEGRYLCEECESGRLPLYDEIVWVKLGAYRWWPAQILFPADVPTNVGSIPHTIGEFVVRFFGSHDHYWVNRGRVFLFQEGDTGHASSKKSAVDGLFVKAIDEATKAHKRFIEDRESRQAEARNGMRPPPYVKIKVNKPVGNVRTNDADTSNTTPCDCNPTWDQPCGPDSDCLNRILMTECNPMVCAAGVRCCNQYFEKRLYAPVIPFKTSGRGWGLKTLAPVKKGSFVIEYVGELINEKEYHRRMKRKHEQKDENYYFLTIDKDRLIDAGPKGNVARFMNHSCSPNCETQKWTVNGDTRVGLFAITDIPAGAELTFNYNLECIGDEKKVCICGAQNCSGFIGDKAKQDESNKKRKSIKSKKKKPPTETKAEVVSCFVCRGPEAIQPCDREACNKFYHWSCVGLETFQEGKWYCPWHTCNFCTKRTTRCCYMCINSYCPIHSDGNIRYDRIKGFVCTTHDIKEEEESKEDGEDSKTKEKLKKTKKPIRISMDNRSSTDSSKNTEDVETTEAETVSPVTTDEIDDKSKSTESSSDNGKDEMTNSDNSSDKEKKNKVKKVKKEAIIEDKKEEDSKLIEKIDEIKSEEKEIVKEFKEVKNGANESKGKEKNTEEKEKNKEEDKKIDKNSIKKRKSRMSLKQIRDSSTNSSNSDECSDDDKPLALAKKIKLDQKDKIEEIPVKVLRSHRSISQDKSLINSERIPEIKSTKKKRSLSLTDVDNTSSSDSDFIVSPKNFTTKRGRIAKKIKLATEEPKEPKKLRSSIQNSSEIKDNKEKILFEDQELQISIKRKEDNKKTVKTPQSEKKKLDKTEEEKKPKTSTPKQKLSAKIEDLESPKPKKFNLSLKKHKLENPTQGVRRSGRYSKPEETTDEEIEEIIEISSCEEDTNKSIKKSLRSHKLEDSDDNIDYAEEEEEKKQVKEETTPEVVKRKRGRPRKYPLPTPQITASPQLSASPPPPKLKGRPKKSIEQPTEVIKVKPTDQIPKYENHVKEVKLTANVPERHLRVVLRKSEIETKIENKFIKMQNDIEKDLPIRKRSKLRYESQL